MATEQVSAADTFQAVTRAGKAANRNRARDSWTLSSSYSMTKGNTNNTVQMTVNPNSVKFSQSKRISTPRKTIGGTTYFNWTDVNGRNLDVITMSISGETGTITGLGKTTTQQAKTGLITVGGTYQGTRAQKNAQNFAKWYNLTAEPAIDPKILVPNVWTIRYKSLIFPDIIFSGFYMNVLDFTDEAVQNPFNKKYSVVFIVTAVKPDILVIQNWIGSIDVTLAQQSVKGVTSGTPPAAGQSTSS